MKNSKRKGKVGELEASKALADALGCTCRRGQQYQGTIDSPDLITSIDGVHFEVKRTEALQLRHAVAQAKADAGDKVPVVLHRWNRGEWLVIVPLKRLTELVALLNHGAL